MGLYIDVVYKEGGAEKSLQRIIWVFGVNGMIMLRKNCARVANSRGTHAHALTRPNGNSQS